MGLARKAQVGTDLTQGFVRVLQERSGFADATVVDVTADACVQFFREFFEKESPAFSGKFYDICNRNRLIDMGGNVLHAGIDFKGEVGWNLMLGDPLGKVDGHIVLEIFDGLFGLEFFTFLNVGVDQLIGLLHVQSARDGGIFSHT